MNKYLCCCCDQELSSVGKYYVCHHCKMVAFTEDIPFEEKRNAINQYLEEVQKKILAKQDQLHDLEQRHDQRQELSAEEQKIYDNVSEFQSVRRDLIFMTKTANGMKEIKMLLYRLLMISDWLNEKFEIEA